MPRLPYIWKARKLTNLYLLAFWASIHGVSICSNTHKLPHCMCTHYLVKPRFFSIFLTCLPANWFDYRSWFTHTSASLHDPLVQTDNLHLSECYGARGFHIYNTIYSLLSNGFLFRTCIISQSLSMCSGNVKHEYSRPRGSES